MKIMKLVWTLSLVRVRGRGLGLDSSVETLQMEN